MGNAFDAMRKFSRDMSEHEAEQAGRRAQPFQTDVPDGPLLPLRLLVPMLVGWAVLAGVILYFLA